jgi:hypothetical protein
VNLFDPLYNLREAVKNLILLEDHLVHPHKRCTDCITKHFLTIEALCDEGVSLEPEHPLCQMLSELANVAQEGLAFYVDGGDPCYIGRALRGARKAIMPKILRVAHLDLQVEPEICPHRLVSRYLEASLPVVEALLSLSPTVDKAFKVLQGGHPLLETDPNFQYNWLAHLKQALKLLPRMDRKGDEKVRAWLANAGEGLNPDRPANPYGAQYAGWVAEITGDRSFPRDLEHALDLLRGMGRRATKTDAEKEDEQASDMIKPEPELKPPREDLRKNKLKVNDDDMEDLGADGDRDLSLNYKRVASLYAAVMRVAGKVPSKAEAKDGDYWPTDKGWGVWPTGTDNVQSAPDEETAAAMAAGSDVETEDPAEGGEDSAEAEAEAAIKEQEEAEKVEREERREKAREKKLQEIRITKAIEQMDDTVRKTISESGMTSEAKRDLSKALEKLSEEELGEAAKVFADKVANFSTPEYVTGDGLTGRASMDAREALSIKPEDLKRKSPKDLGEALAKRAFAQNVVANPSMLNGKALDPDGMDTEGAEVRAKEALRFYRDSSPEIREEALTQASDQLKEMRDDDPRREELERIVDGLAMSAVIHDEDLKGARPRPGEPLAILAREMDKVGEADKLVMSPEKVYQPEGVAAVEDAMKRMVTTDPISGEVDTEKLTDFLGGEKGPYGGMIKSLKAVEKDLDSSDRETRENAEELHAFVLETMQMLKTNEMTIGHGIMRAMARGETTRKQEVSQVEKKVKSKPKSIREQLEEQSKDEESVEKADTETKGEGEKEREDLVGPVSDEDQDAWAKCREEGRSQKDCLERENARSADSLLNKAMSSKEMATDMDKYLECIRGGSDPEECRDQLLTQQAKSIYSAGVEAHGEPSGDDPLVQQVQEAIQSENPSELREKWVKKESRTNSLPPDPHYLQSSFYTAGHIGEGISFACGLLHPQDSRRRPLTMARKLTPQVANKITADLNKLAGLYANEFKTLGVPKDVAQDFARKCALMSKGLKRTAHKRALDEDPPVQTDYPQTGPTYDAEEIGVEEAGPLEDEPDEPFMNEQFTQQENRELREKQEDGTLEKQKVDDEEKPPAPGVQASLEKLQAEKALADSESLRGRLSAMADNLREASRKLGADRRSRVKAIGGELSHMAGQIDNAVTSYDESVKAAGKAGPFLRNALARVEKVAGEVLPHVKGRIRQPARVAEVVRVASSILSA